MRMTLSKPLEEMLGELPMDARREVEDFTSFIWEKYRLSGRSNKKQLKLSWRGGLKELRGQYTSVELQHKILNWWDKNVSR